MFDISHTHIHKMPYIFQESRIFPAMNGMEWSRNSRSIKMKLPPIGNNITYIAKIHVRINVYLMCLYWARLTQTQMTEIIYLPFLYRVCIAFGNLLFKQRQIIIPIYTECISTGEDHCKQTRMVTNKQKDDVFKPTPEKVALMQSACKYH